MFCLDAFFQLIFCGNSTTVLGEMLIEVTLSQGADFPKMFPRLLAYKYPVITEDTRAKEAI